LGETVPYIRTASRYLPIPAARLGLWHRGFDAGSLEHRVISDGKAKSRPSATPPSDIRITGIHHQAVFRFPKFEKFHPCVFQ
jgi:hypothetical protein